MVTPKVSVIIATYNYSSVLRCAIKSALDQTFENFELLVVGDGCTDDSAEVVASFKDHRVRWHNLPSNSGYQATPNNTGLAMAQGQYVAYLGHDDLWLPDHLARLVEALERENADVAYSLGIMIGPPGSPLRVLSGTSPLGQYQPETVVTPSTLMHRTEAARRTGGWRDYRQMHAPTDLAFVADLWAAGYKFVGVREVTVLKFPAAWRKDVYRQRPSSEQEYYLARLKDADLLVSELTATALAYAEGNARRPAALPEVGAGSPAGAQVDLWRDFKGLPRASGERGDVPLYRDPAALRLINRRRDVVPASGLDALYSGNELPERGIFLGRGWYELEHDGSRMFRWLNTDGELIVTRAGRARRIVMDAESGPGQNRRPFELVVVDDEGTPIASATVSYRHKIAFKLPDCEEGAVLRLIAPAGASVAGDPRILNLRVFGIRWGLL